VKAFEYSWRSARQTFENFEATREEEKKGSSPKYLTAHGGHHVTDPQNSLPPQKEKRKKNHDQS
jgi:hypothetical protein